MRKPKPSKSGSKASSKMPSAPYRSASSGWDAWHQPKVFIPLLTAVLTAAGVAAALLSKPDEQPKGDTFTGPVQSVGEAPAVSEAGPVDQVSRQPPQAEPAPPGRSRALPGTRPVAPKPSEPKTAQQPAVTISVDRSPGAITAGTINANSIEVSPPQ